MYIYIYVYIDVHMYAYIHTDIQTYIHTYIHTCVYVYMCIYIHASIHPCIHTYLLADRSSTGSNLDSTQETPKDLMSGALGFSGNGGSFVGVPDMQHANLGGVTLGLWGV